MYFICSDSIPLSVVSASSAIVHVLPAKGQSNSQLLAAERGASQPAISSGPNQAQIKFPADGSGSSERSWPFLPEWTLARAVTVISTHSAALTDEHTRMSVAARAEIFHSIKHYLHAVALCYGDELAEPPLVLSRVSW